jgi:magnesium transporter
MSAEERAELVERLRAVFAAVTTAGEEGEESSAPDLTDALRIALEGVHPADIAEAMERLSDEESLQVFGALDNTRAAEVLDELDQDKARYLLDNDVPGRIADLLEILPPDDAAEIVAEIAEASPARAEELLTELAEQNPEDATEIKELLSYGEKTAGRLMTDKFVRLRADMTVDEAFVSIRRSDPEVETLNDLFVVDVPSVYAPEAERLLGVVSLRGLVRANPQDQVSAIMARDLITVNVDTDQEEVAQLISKYDFLALPVLDRVGNLAGIVTVDDVVDVLVEEQTEDVLKQGAIEPGVLNLPYFSTPITKVVRSRVTWLVLLFAAETATGSVLRHFDSELAKVTALSYFIPLLIGTGGNTGAQTVSTIIRGMAVKEIRARDTFRVLVREMGSGLLLGLVLGLIAFGRSLLWKTGTDLALVVGLSILAICAWANTIGCLIPLVAQRFKIDPALVSAPLITTLVDATGLAIYLWIAKLLLHQLH